jgi:hypothetical protein
MLLSQDGGLVRGRHAAATTVAATVAAAVPDV